MTTAQIALTLIISSFAVFIAFLIASCFFYSKKKKHPEKYYKIVISPMLLFSIGLVFSIILLRFAVEFFTVSELNLNTQEEFTNSVFKAIRTFSMEEDYGEFIADLKFTIGEILPDIKPDHASFIQWITVFYASILSFTAPVVGGALVLGIFARAFPRFRLRSRLLLNLKRRKYYFSELNAASLSLAKSIYYKEQKDNPLFIFTDTYVDDENEKEYELLLEAKKYGAICIRDDLAHVAKTRFGERSYFLMDADELGNIKTLMELTADNSVKFIRDSKIYLFVQSDSYVQIEKQINKEFEKDEKKALLKGCEKPTIVPINGYRNLVQNLFSDVPLYEPLIHKKDKTKLNITIMGNGIIGTEAFLSAYWFGQMLVCQKIDGKEVVSECDMTINIVSKDKEGAFWSKIDYVNPEIKQTVEVLGHSADENKNNLLDYDNKGNKNKKYCNVRYVQSDVKIDGFWDSNSEDTKQFLGSDYFVVALGNDSDNISVADKLRRYIGKKHLEAENNDSVNDVVIAYAVFNSELVNMIGNQKYYHCRENSKADIYMYAFGSLKQVYSYDNVYMSKNKLLAEGIGAAYNESQVRQNHISDNKKRNLNEDKNYTHWADLARALHVKYKVFSLGLIEKSIFDFSSDSTGNSHREYMEKQTDVYKQLSLKLASSKLEDFCDELKFKINLLAWLEHRRWVSFTRTMGYQRTGEFKRNLELNGQNHKNMELKLHPCLVEAEKPTFEASKNVYQQKVVEELFISMPYNIDDKIKEIENLDRNQMITEIESCLKDRLANFEERQKKFAKLQNIDEFDLLDKLTCEWFNIATEKSIIINKASLAAIQSDADKLSNNEVLEIFKQGWNGISCYDFKMYDYLSKEYDSLKIKK